eukprot:TRINITY_DN9060_c0_g1_i2.p1 TRINITY_DN9060_c0_g1~~TRINITY_DN9060_c0_g1_i2.p1  ORF type:complete len:136 (-),score=35.89 TRINITY_DN9060_c0_g1_i2:51-437(-)
MIRRPPRSTLDRSSAASDVYKRQAANIGDLDLSSQVITFKLRNPSTVIGVSGLIFEIDISEDTKDAFKIKATLKNSITMVPGTFSLFDVQASSYKSCLLYTSPSPRDRTRSRMPSSACKKKKKKTKKI